MTSSQWRAGVTGVLAAALSVGLLLSCRQIIGIPDADPTIDPHALDQADGGGGGGSPSPLCQAYCDAVGKYCTGKDQMYPSDAACYGVCANLPPGTAKDTTGNTVQCRYTFALSHEDGECQNAGPLGGGVCGTPCESYCLLVAAVCPEQFKTFEDNAGCLAKCAGIPFDPPYSAEAEPHENSLSCRAYHLSSATFNPAHHCPHTIGIEYCPDADAGGGAGGGGGGGGSGSSGGGGS